MILIIDNYDSFTYNLVHQVARIDGNIKVIRNDELSILEVKNLNPSKIIISPGPGNPDSAGITNSVISNFAPIIPILGVCLGHQAIGQVFGGEIIRAKNPVHGKIFSIFHKNKGIFENIPNPFKATRYHSLIIKKDSFPKELNITAATEDGIIMAIEHKRYQTYGVQFHPESVTSEYGNELIQNFLRL